MPGHKRKRDQEDASAVVAGAAGADANACAADTKKQKTAVAVVAAAARAAVHRHGSATEIVYHQPQVYMNARDACKFRMGKLLERFERARPHVENIRAHLHDYDDNLEECESLVKSFKVLRKFFRLGMDDAAHGQHELDIMYLSSFTPLAQFLLSFGKDASNLWLPFERKMHRRRIQAAKARAAKWEAAHSDEEAGGLVQKCVHT